MLQYLQVLAGMPFLHFFFPTSLINFQDYDVFTRQKCDTFSRSADAVFELSTRFAEPFSHADGLSAEQQLEKERLMFLELTQGSQWTLSPLW